MVCLALFENTVPREPQRVPKRVLTNIKHVETLTFQRVHVVEVRGVEPLSESMLIEPSPSAFKDLGFPSVYAP